MKRAIIILAVAGAATGAIAAEPSPLGPPPPSRTGLPTGQCIRSHDIRNHTIADNRTLLLNVNGKSVYRVTMAGACLSGAISSDPIITREPPGTSIICRPLDLDIGISKAGFETRCIVDSIVKLSPQETAALPARLKP